jgi:hypothetical protein
MIEYLPHLWVSEYYTFDFSFLSSKKIHLILHLSDAFDFYKTEIEQIRIPLEKSNVSSDRVSLDRVSSDRVSSVSLDRVSSDRVSSVSLDRVSSVSSDNVSIEEKNALMYNHLFDVTDLIHQRITQTNPVLILSNGIQKELFVASYFIRFAKVLPRESLEYIQSKKKDLSLEIIEYNNCLNKFYCQIRNF